jgi:ribosomal protein L13E
VKIDFSIYIYIYIYMGDTLAELIARGVSLVELIAAGFSIAELRAAGITAGEFNFSAGCRQIGQDIDGEAADDRSGHSLSVSEDGSIVAIGAYRNDGNGTDSGHVRVYQNESGTWTQIGQDIDGEAAGDRSGNAVSLSADGSIVAIGAYLNDGNGTFSGHVRVYQNVSGTWTQLGQDIDGEDAFDRSGHSLSLSADGSIVAIGAYGNDGNGNYSGHVRVYQNVSGTWTQIGQDIDGEAADDRSGYSVSLSNDGSIVAIGAYLNDDNGNASGHVRVYKNESGTWTQIGEDLDGDAGDEFGYSVSLSADGSIVAIGAVLGNESNSGYVRVYQNVSGTWTQLGQDIDGEAEDDNSGYSVSLSADGSIVAIGAYRNDGNGTFSGQVRVYKNESGTWTQIDQDIDGEAAGDQSGFSVSLSADGSIVAIGAPYNDDNGTDSGHVRVLNYFDSLTTPVTELKDGGYTATELKTAGFTAIELKTAGFTAIELKTAGYTATELKTAGFTLAELVAAGFRAELKTAGFTAIELKDAGFTLAELVAAGFRAELISVGFSIAELRAAGITAGEFNFSAGWRQIGQDIDGEAAGDNSGYAVSLSADGSIVAIGARYNDDNGSASGHVRVYQNESGTWTQLGQDLDGEAAIDRFGWSVSLSADGSIVAIGAIFNNGGNGSSSGHVRVYQNGGGTWTQIGQDIDGEASSDDSGWSVSLSADGSIVAIGAPYNDGNGTNSGHVRVYKNESGTWTQIGQDIDGEGAGDNSGWSVSLSNDGSIVAIGAIYNDGNGFNSGHVRVYKNESGTWTQIGQDIDGEAEFDYSGRSVSLS